MNRKSLASILLFAGSALSFFLPFLTVSCAGENVLTLSGQQMATGTTMEQPQPFGPPRQQRIDPDPFAMVAALCGLAGIVLSIAGRRLAAGAAISGAAGAVSLGVMASRMGGQIQSATQGMGRVDFQSGFFLALALMIAATAWNIYLLAKNSLVRERVGSAQQDRSVVAGPPHV